MDVISEDDEETNTNLSEVVVETKRTTRTPTRGNDTEMETMKSKARSLDRLGSPKLEVIYCKLLMRSIL